MLEVRFSSSGSVHDDSYEYSMIPKSIYDSGSTQKSVWWPCQNIFDVCSKHVQLGQMR